MKNKITVDIADDHQVVQTGLQSMLRAFPQIRLGHVYSNGEELMAGLKKHRPDVLLLDIQMPDTTGDELIVLIRNRYPSVRILTFTGFDTMDYVRTMLDKGASGYLLKNTQPAILSEAIQATYRGEQYIEPSLRQRLIDDLLHTGKQESQRPVLTRREKDVMKLILQEYTSQEIARKLNVSFRTVENQRVSLMQKLEVKNTAGLVKTVIQMKLIEDI